MGCDCDCSSHCPGFGWVCVFCLILELEQWVETCSFYSRVVGRWWSSQYNAKYETSGARRRCDMSQVFKFWLTPLESWIVHLNQRSKASHEVNQALELFLEQSLHLFCHVVQAMLYKYSPSTKSHSPAVQHLQIGQFKRNPEK